MTIGPAVLPSGARGTAFSEPRWYAAYTCANHEKRVAEQLEARSVEHFLPVYESIRRWKDRRVQLRRPLFPGYLFVRIALRERLQVLQVPGVARLVGFNAFPEPLPDNQIEAIRNALDENLCINPHPYLTSGRRVRIKRGALADMEGVLVRAKGKCRVILTIDAIVRSVAVELDLADVEFLSLQKWRWSDGVSLGCERN